MSCHMSCMKSHFFSLLLRILGGGAGFFLFFGIMAGDKIVTIEDTIVAGKEMATRDVVKRLRGERGTEVNVGILRGQENKLRQFTITRDEIPINSMDVANVVVNVS